MSGELPAESGTITLIGFAGQLCAAALPQRPISTMLNADKLRHMRPSLQAKVSCLADDAL